MGIHCNHAKPLSPFFRKEFFSKDHRLFFKRDHVSGTGNNKKAKKYSYFFANSSNVLPSNWQIAFL